MERIVDVEDIALAGRRARREVIDQRAPELRRVPLRRRVLEAADGRLRGERRARLRTAADRHFHRRIVAQHSVIDAVLVTTTDAEHAGADDLAQAMAHARLVAPVRQRGRQARDDADLLLRRPQQQHTGVRRLVAAVEINCELLAPDGRQIKGKRC